MVILVIMISQFKNYEVIKMSSDNDKSINDDSNLRMRKRFQEIDETRRLQKEARAGWIYIMYMGFAILVVGFFGVLVAENIFTLSTELIIAVALILIGFFFMFTAYFVRDTVELDAIEHYRKKGKF